MSTTPHLDTLIDAVSRAVARTVRAWLSELVRLRHLGALYRELASLGRDELDDRTARAVEEAEVVLAKAQPGTHDETGGQVDWVALGRQGEDGSDE